MSRVSLFFMRKTFILALHQGKSVQNRGQSVILSGENHRLAYTITGGVTSSPWFLDAVNVQKPRSPRHAFDIDVIDHQECT